MAIKIGIFVFTTSESQDTAVLAKRAEALGFESFWVPEHPIIPVYTTSAPRSSPDGSIAEPYRQIIDPFMALARASGSTRTIKLGTGICLIPERNPLVLAKEVASLDHLSGGRFIFGIGAGWLKEEIEIMGGNYQHRWTQTREAIAAMKELWTKDEAEYHGEYYDFPPVRSYPKPAQKPYPPIFLGGKADNVFKRVVAWGDGWMPNGASIEEIKAGRATLKELAVKAGRDPGSIELMAFGGSGQYRNKAAITELEEAGASRVTVWLDHTEGDQSLREMEEIAKQVLP